MTEQKCKQKNWMSTPCSSAACPSKLCPLISTYHYTVGPVASSLRRHSFYNSKIPNTTLSNNKKN